MDFTLVKEAQTVPLYKRGNSAPRYPSYWLAEITQRQMSKARGPELPRDSWVATHASHDRNRGQ